MQKACSLDGKSFYALITGVEGSESFHEALQAFDEIYDKMSFSAGAKAQRKKIYEETLKMLMEGKSFEDVIEVWDIKENKKLAP